MSRLNNPRLAYVDRHFLLNGICSIWNSEVREYAWDRGQIQCSLMHFITWIGPLISGLIW